MTIAKGIVIRACPGQWDSLKGESEDMTAEGLSIPSDSKLSSPRLSDIQGGGGSGQAVVDAFYPGLEPRAPLPHTKNGAGVCVAVGRTSSEGERD